MRRLAAGATYVPVSWAGATSFSHACASRFRVKCLAWPGILAFYDAHRYWPTQEVQQCLHCGDLVEHPERGKARHVHQDLNRPAHAPRILDDPTGKAA